MEFEQLIKRLDWLDEEHRKDKNILSLVDDRLSTIENSLNVLSSQVKEISTGLASVSSASARIDHFDEALNQHRLEINHFIEDIEKRRVDNQNNIDKRYRTDIDGIGKSITSLRKSLDSIKDIKRELKTHSTEEIRLNHELSEVINKFDEIKRTNEDILRAQRIYDESHRRDTKQITDLQNEISTIRKKIEKTGEKNDLVMDNFRKVESRLSELLASEADRRQSQIAFLEVQSRAQVEREKAWKEWEIKFNSINEQSEALDVQLRYWDTTQRSIKRAQETYDDLIQKFERRINEISEMQRLAEDRFRQEWMSFKADDQKRWTSHTLTQDEVNKDEQLEIQKIGERIALVEDISQTQQDIIQQTKEANEQLLHGILAQIHELLSTYERIMGSAQ